MKNILTAGLYFVAFMLIQIIVQGSAGLLCKQMSVTMSSTALVLTSIIGGAITIGVFAWRRWSPFSREYMQQRRWDVFVWTALMALGIVAPMQLIIDLSGLEMSVTAQQLFTQLLSNQWGLLAVAVVVPLAEEMAFRGAILRTLLDHFGPSGRWWAILLSALLFGMPMATPCSLSTARLWAYSLVGSIGARAALRRAWCSTLSTTPSLSLPSGSCRACKT